MKLRILARAVCFIFVTFFFLALATVIVPGQQSGATQYLRMHEKPRQLFDRWSDEMNKAEGKVLTARDRFVVLPVSRRSTFAAATNALLYTKLTDPSGKKLGYAIDLVQDIKEIAGQEEGRGSDEQFRLYVRLKPGARQLLELSREFKRGKDNTVFHKGFPINYRQDGAAPTMQFSIATDEINADIDVDYRSSAFPQALFNGHLSASNSDVRANPNYQTHLRRWSGLLDWWDDEFPDLVREFVANISKGFKAEFLPQSSAKFTSDASAVSDSAHSFFKSWLIEHRPEVAMTYLQSKLSFCSNLKDPIETQRLDRRSELLFLDTLKAANKELKKSSDLGRMIAPVAPVDPAIKPVEHQWKNLFTVALISDGDADHHFLCTSKSSGISDPSGSIGRPRTYGKHYVVKFQFRLENGKGGILRLLWTQENGVWKIEAFDAVTA